MPDSRAKLTPILLTACLLAGTVISPVQAQETPGEILSISRTGHFPAIDTNNRGGFVLAWTNIDNADQEIYGAVLAPGGSFPGPPLFVVNTRLNGIQTDPDVAAGPRGDFMVVWQGGTFSNPEGGDGDREGVFGVAFSRTGTNLKAQRRLSQRTAAPQVTPEVAALEDGGYAAVWQDQRTGRFEIVTRRFAFNGDPTGPELPMQVGGEYNNVGGIAAYPGGFAVAWNEGFGCSGGRSDAGVAAIARFDSSGRRVGRVFRVGTLECEKASAVAALAGSRAGALALLLTPAGYSIQRFSPSGEPVGGQPMLSRGSICVEDRCSFIHRVAMDDRGRFAVLWDVSDATTRNLFVQVFTPPGRPMTDRIPVASVPLFSLSTPDLALTNEGTLGVVWRGENDVDPEETGLFLWRYELP